MAHIARYVSDCAVIQLYTMKICSYKFFAAPNPPGKIMASKSLALSFERSSICPRAIRADSTRTFLKEKEWKISRNGNNDDNQHTRAASNPVSHSSQWSHVVPHLLTLNKYGFLSSKSLAPGKKD